MNTLHEQFVAETRELIQQATDDLIAVERDGPSAERIDRIFRAFHTLKGSAGVVELPAMTLTLHAAEDLLAAIHGGRLGVTSTMVDEALACLDQVSQWVDAFEAQGALPLQAGQDAQAMARRLRNQLPGNAPQETAASDRGASGTVSDRPLPEWVSRLVQAERVSIFRHVQNEPGEFVAISYEPRAGCFFDGDDPLGLMRRIPNLLAVRIEPRDPWPPVVDLDPYVCNLRLQGIAAGGRAGLAEILRLVADQVQVIDIPPEALSQNPGTLADGGEAIDIVRLILDEQRKVLAASQSDDRPGRLGAVARAAANVLRHHLRTDLARPFEGTLEAAGADPAVLLSMLDEALASLVPAAPIADGGEPRIEPPSESRTEEPGRVATRSLRVDEARIDKLFNLAGELIVAKNAFAHLTKRIENEIGGHELARAVRREQEAIERLVGEMHAAILQLRMVPLAQVFRPLPRLVRDMAQRLNKNVSLVTRGETTEADKTIVDRLFEPLLHLVRNAVDHGIERFEQRVAARKPEVATVTVAASRVGDRLIVEVGDDGRGIEPDIVRRKAGERGLAATEELAALSDEQVLDLVFTPGFSTAAEVSDISGRGVGMDVVRTSIEQIGGRVSLASGIGAGTTVRLDLPMSIAMTRIMVVETGGQVFGIPMDAVTETVRLPQDRIRHIKGNEGFVLRDEVVPICSLAELIGLANVTVAPSRLRLLVIMEAGGRIVGVEVDAIRDRLEVVLKPMQGLLSNAHLYLGTTLLGDGRVLLVLNTKELLA